jgi:hypothetical protein
MRTRWLIPIYFCVASSVFATARQQSQALSTNGLALAQKAQAALSGSFGISDVTLSGTGTRTVGPDSETGNFTLEASGTSLSRFDFLTGGGTLSEVFNLSASGASSGFWIGTDGANHSMALHNTLAGAVWFFPPLSVLSQSAGPNALVSYVGEEAKLGVSVQHIRIAAQNSSLTASENSMLQQFSVTDFYLDPSTFLPVAMVYATHPDSDQNTDIIVEVDFSDYRAVRGVLIPFHIRKYFNASLCWDLTVTSASMNTGLASSMFSVN